MKNKKLLIVFAFALCAIRLFSATPGKVVAKIPEEISRDSIYGFAGYSDDDFIFVYKVGDEYYFTLNGEKIGPFVDEPHGRRVGENFALAYSDDDEKVHFVLNGKEVGVYDDLYWMYVRKEYGKFVLFVQENEKWFLITEEKTYGPFDNRPDFFLYKKNGSTCFCVDEGGFDYVYIDGEKRGPYSFVREKGVLIGEVDRFIYSWADPKTTDYYVCIEDEDKGPYNYVTLFPSGDGSAYYLAESLDYKTIYIMCEDKILKELDASVYSSTPSSGTYMDDGIIISLWGSYFSHHLILLLKDGQIVSELKESYSENPDSAFEDVWVTCPAGVFGPYIYVQSLEFDDEGHAVWSAENGSAKFGLYVDGKLIYETDNSFLFSDFKMKGNDFLFRSGYDFDVVNVNGREYKFDRDTTVIGPDFVPGTDGFTFFAFNSSSAGSYFCYGDELYMAYINDDTLYYLDGNKIKKLSLLDENHYLLNDLLLFFK